MIELLASIGWGLITIGAITHTWHHRRLQHLIAMHVNRERVPAALLTLIEVALAIAIPVFWLSGTQGLSMLAIAAAALAIGFVLWIARLLTSDSDLPCACSFSEAPTTIWSLARSLCVVLVVLFVAVDPVASGLSSSEAAAVLCTGLAVAAAIFVVPEAISWPAPSRAILARADAFDSSEA